MELLPWTRLDRPDVAGSFISRRVQPCQKRVHAGYEYQGSADQTKMRPNQLHDDEIKRRIADLFSLADPSYHPFERHRARVQAHPTSSEGISSIYLSFVSIA
jgi:hypothetical protein